MLFLATARNLAAKVGESSAAAAGRNVRCASSNADPIAYPFSRTAIVTPSTSATPPPANLLSPRNGTSVINHVNEQLRATYDLKSLTTTLFSRRHRDRALPGSVLSVISYTSASKTSTSIFSGVLMGIRRRGIDTAFTLRNVIAKVGVEVDFKVVSPLIKEIRVVRRADGKSGLKNLGRAKVGYLRDRPGAMNQIAGALKSAR